MGQKSFAVLIAAAVAAPAYGAATTAPLAVPAGITFQLTKTGIVYASPEGKTLYTADADANGVSSCTDQCAKDWTPAVAPPDAKAAGDWMMSTRPDGSRQWVFKGKPLYSSPKDKVVGDIAGLAAGWHTAALVPAAPAGLPPDMAVHESAALPGQILVNAEGHTVYAGPLDCTGPCAEMWIPVTAPGIAGTSGDFTAVKRRDGSRQWAYKGAPLFTFRGDLRDGELAGRGADSRFQVAALASYFMPAGVTVRPNLGDALHPEILATADGRTLYARENYSYTQTFHALNGDRGTPIKGRMIGATGCTGECLASWKPLAAPENATAAGHWTVMTRDDGTKQWAYQGYALYTFAGDKKPGDTHGNERFDQWEKNLVGLAPRGAYGTASTMYWRTASP